MSKGRENKMQLQGMILYCIRKGRTPAPRLYDNSCRQLIAVALTQSLSSNGTKGLLPAGTYN